MVGHIPEQLEALAGHILIVEDFKGFVVHDYAVYQSESQKGFFPPFGDGISQDVDVVLPSSIISEDWLENEKI